MSRYDLAISGGGTRFQSGIPKGDPRDAPLRSGGLSFQGVVVATYPYDSRSGPGQTQPEGEQNAIYCDVLCYGKHEGVIPRVLWMPGHGMHEGDIRAPRVAKMEINGSLDLLASNPTAIDGDHVIVSFLEDDIRRPFVAAQLLHPSSDLGNSGRLIGHRMRLKESDGQPRFTKHRGVFWGVSDSGDFVIDATRAHPGVFQSNGSEPEPGLDGSNGNIVLRLPESSKLTIEVTQGVQQGDGTDSDTASTKLVLENGKITIVNNGGAGLVVQNSGSAAQMVLGDGAVHAAIAEHMQTLWGQLVTYLTSATVLTALGPSAPIPVTSGPPPAWLASIKSNKSSLPDG